MRLFLLFVLFTTLAFAQVKYPNDLEGKRDLLDTIQIQNRIRNADTLMNRVRQAYPKNHNTDSLLLSFKFEEQLTIVPKELDIELLRSPNGKSSKAVVNRQLKEMTTDFKSKPLKTYQKSIGNYSALANRGVFIDVNEAYEIKSFKNYTALDDLIPKVKEAMGDEIDQETLYKIKSGWIPIDKSARLEIDEDTASTYTITTKSGEKKEIQRRIGNRILYNINSLLSGSTYEKENEREQLLDPEWYQFEIDDYVVTDSTAYYIVSFKPNYRKADFAGIFHIDADDFGIKKLDFKFAKGENGESLNIKWLFGFKYREHYNSHSVSYERHKSGVYVPVSVKKVVNSYMYIHRPIKLKENDTKNVHKFDVTGEGNIEMVEELTVLKIEPFKEKISSITIKGLSKFTGINSTD